MSHGKKYRAALKEIDLTKTYTPSEALAFIKAHPLAKFDEAVEVHAHLGINTKKSDEGVRATAVLPHGSGRTQRVAVVTTTKEAEARAAGASLVGGAELIDDIKAGKTLPGTHFDLVIATPEMMPKLAQVAKILGPKGMMPSPKTETVTQKIGETVEMLSKGKKVSFKNDDTGNVHQVIGRLSFEGNALAENLDIFLAALEKAKPEGLKGKFIARLTLSTTMGPSLPISRGERSR